MHYNKGRILSFGVALLAVTSMTFGMSIETANASEPTPTIKSETVREKTQKFASTLVIVTAEGSELISITNKSDTVESLLKDRGYKPENFTTDSGKPILSGEEIENGSRTVVYTEDITGTSETIELPVADTITIDENLYEGQKIVEKEGKPGKALKTTVATSTLKQQSPDGESTPELDKKAEEEVYLTILEAPEPKQVTVGSKKCDFEFVCKILESGKGNITVAAKGEYVHPLGKIFPWATYTGDPGHEAGAIDFPVSSGTPIYSVADGEVSEAGWLGGGGNMVIIRHADGYYTAYAHMVEKPIVKAGDKVRAGQLIGLVGSTGNSTGPHLHFEIFKDKNWGLGAPAYEYMKFHGVDLGPCTSGPCTYSKKSDLK